MTGRPHHIHAETVSANYNRKLANAEYTTHIAALVASSIVYIFCDERQFNSNTSCVVVHVHGTQMNGTHAFRTSRLIEFHAAQYIVVQPMTFARTRAHKLWYARIIRHQTGVNKQQRQAPPKRCEVHRCMCIVLLAKTC